MLFSYPLALKKNKEINIPGIALCVDRFPESDRLLYGNSDFKIYEIEPLGEKPAPEAFKGDGHQSYVTGIALADKQAVSGSYDGHLIWWNAESKEKIKSVPAHKLWIRRVTASPDKKTVASVADDMSCKLWDASNGKLIYTLNDHKKMTPHNYPSMLYAVAFSRDGKWLATGDKVGHVVIWNLANGKKEKELEAPGFYTWDPKQRRHSIGGIRSLAFSNDSKLLSIGGIGKIGNIDHLGGPSRVEIHEWQAAKKLHTIEDNKLKGLVEQMEFAADSSWLFAAGGDNGGFVTFYNVATGKLIKQEKAPMHIHQFSMNEAQTRAYTVGHKKIAVFDFLLDRPDAPPLPENA
jgi:WD40 repeat protein